jgi:hypothetical protein
MHKITRCLIFAAAAVGAASAATAQELKLSMADGRVTLIATDVPLRQILAEWARIGDTRIVNGDKVVGAPVTIELVDYPEGRALDLLLRDAAGYMAAPRPADRPGPSVYDRIMILPTSRPPAATAVTTPAPFNRNLMPQPMPVPVDDDDNEPPDQQPVPPPGMVPQGMPAPGMPPPGGQFPPGQGPQQQQPPMTSPRPGPLPQPQQPGVPNPYAPPGTPGARPQAPPGRPGG